MNKLLPALFSSLMVSVCSGQITGPTSATINTPVVFSAANPGSFNSWAFNDTVDFSSNTGTLSTVQASFNGTGSSTMIADNLGNWYLFASALTVDGKLYRLSFGTNPNGTPTESVATTIPGPNHLAVDVVRDDVSGNWHGFLVGAKDTLWRLDFGNSPANTPVVSNPMIFADAIINPRQITLRKDGGVWFAFIGNYLNKIGRLSLGNSLSNTPVSTSADMPNSNYFFGAATGLGTYFALHKEGVNWHMLATQVSILYRLDFGNSLANVPTFTRVGEGNPYQRAISIGIVADCRNVVAYCMQGQGTSGMIKMNFNGSITNTPTTSFMTGISSAQLTSVETAVPYVHNGALNFILNYWTASASYPLRRFKVLDLPAGSISNQNPVTRTFTNPGTYKLALYTDMASPRGSSGYCHEITIVPGALPKPAPFTDSSVAVCKGQNQVLYAIPTIAGATGYNWTYTGTGHTITGTTGNSIHLDFSPAATSGILSVNAYDGSGASPARSLNITVNPLPAAAVIPAGTASFCQGASLSLRAAAIPHVHYQWAKDNNPIGSNDSVYAAIAGGAYTVTVTDSVTGCSAKSVATLLTTLPTPTADMTPAGTVSFCRNDTVLLHATPSGGNYHYLWTGPGSTSGDTLGSFVPASSGNYRVMVTNSDHCSDTSAIKPVTIHSLPPAVIVPGGHIGICLHDSTILDAGIPAGVNYSWMHGSNIVQSSGSPTYTAMMTGSYQVIVTDINHCVDTSAATTITVYPSPAIRINPSDTAFCTGNTLTLYAATADTGILYQWKDAGGNISGATLGYYQIHATGNYTVIVNRSNVHHCSDSFTMQATVNALPEPSLNWNGILLETDSQYVAYEWYAEGQVSGAGNNHTYMPLSNGSYMVRVTDTNGCSNFSATYNLRNVQVSHTAIAGKINIYPNPVTALLHITAPIPVQATLFDMQGRIVLQKTETGILNMKELRTGIYMLQITGERGMLLRNERILKSE